jgi:uncharacterized protein (TIGR03435 family)
MMRVWALTALTVSHVSAAGPSFEAATIKPNKKGGGPYTQVLPGRLMLTYYSVQDLVEFAYGLRADQVLGKTSDDRFDIEAKADGNRPGSQMTGPMLQALLQDRFKLKLHRETRQLPVYRLKVAKGGVKMPVEKAGNCTPNTPDAVPAAPLPRPAPGESRPIVFFCDILRTGARGLTRTVEGKGISIEALASTLSRTELNRAVLNKTGRKGRFDVNLTWAVDPSIPGLSDNLGRAPLPDADPQPTIFTAVQEQLGLKLEAGRGPVEVLVIDRIEQPSQN